ncbi:hypothetical protein [Geobacillus sp. TFV-3]|uniref:hypothetical protein n=1 Tax=Geobacillus sp. TFV-3 TaxID=1897059 RepID=UPI001F30EC66|nr:hypothetical protein [Geobacillus sp. TFV-3]
MENVRNTFPFRIMRSGVINWMSIFSYGFSFGKSMSFLALLHRNLPKWLPLPSQYVGKPPLSGKRPGHFQKDNDGTFQIRLGSAWQNRPLTDRAAAAQTLAPAPPEKTCGNRGSAQYTDAALSRQYSAFLPPRQAIQIIMHTRRNGETRTQHKATANHSNIPAA